MGTWRFHNITTDEDFWPVLSSINITNQQPCQLATFSGTIVDVDALSDGDEVEALYADDDVTFVKQFAGFVSIETDAHIEPIAEPAVYHFSARDYTTLLDDTIITADRPITESVTDRALWIAAQGNSFGVTTGGIASIATLVGPFNYRFLSKTQAYQQLQSVSGTLFYVDFEKDTQLYSASAVIAAPFDLVTPASPPTSYPYRAFQRSKDRTDQADEVIVGAQDGTFVTRTRGGAPAASLRKQRAITTDSVAETDLETVGDVELDRIGLPMQSGQLVTRQPGLQSGMTVRIVNPTHSIDADYIISQVSVRHVDPNPTEVGGEGGRAEFSIAWADRLQCIPRRDTSLTPPVNTMPDCAICPGTVTLLPAGMDENLSLARGRAGMHVYDGTSLAAYDCNGQLVRSKTPAASALSRIYHEPGIYTGLLAGDRVFHLDPDLGPYGTTRWSIDDAIAAADVMDIRRFWAVGGAVFDDFNRTEAGPDIGDTSGSGLTWVRFQNTVSGSAPSTEVDGTRLHYLRTAAGLAVSDTAFKLMEDDQFWRQAGPAYIFDVTVLFEIGSHPQGNNSFQLFVGDISGAANGGEYDDNGAYVRLRVGTSAANPGEAEPWVLNVGNTIAADVDETLTFDPRTAGPVYLRFMHDGTDWKAKLWPVGDPEPDWGDPDTVERPHDTDDDSITGNLFALYFHHKAFVSGENFEVWVDSITPTTGDGLQSRSMVDGSLIASVSLPSQTFDVRRTPNGQRIFLILWDASEIRRYSRTLELEVTLPLTGDLADFDVGGLMQDWNVDDAYNLYRLADNVLERFDSDGAIEWTRDLNALYGYRFPSRAVYGSAYGSGQQVVTFDNKLRVVGYDGGADWTAGSQALLLSLHPASGTLISERRFGGGATDDAQAIALQPLNNCLWLGGAAQGAEFYGTALSGLTGWILPVDTGDAGGVVTIAIGEDV